MGEFLSSGATPLSPCFSHDSTNESGGSDSVFRIKLVSVFISTLAVLFFIFVVYRWFRHPLISQSAGLKAEMNPAFLSTFLLVLCLFFLLSSLSMARWLLSLDWRKILAREYVEMGLLLQKVKRCRFEGRWIVKKTYWSLKPSYKDVFMWKPILALSILLLISVAALARAGSPIPNFRELLYGHVKPSGIDYIIGSTGSGLDELLKLKLENIIWKIDLIVGG